MPDPRSAFHSATLSTESNASHHRLDIGGLTYTRVLYFDCYFRLKDSGSTCMQINLYLSVYGN